MLTFSNCQLPLPVYYLLTSKQAKGSGGVDGIYTLQVKESISLRSRKNEKILFAGKLL